MLLPVHFQPSVQEPMPFLNKSSVVLFSMAQLSNAIEWRFALRYYGLGLTPMKYYY